MMKFDRFRWTIWKIFRKSLQEDHRSHVENHHCFFSKLHLGSEFLNCLELFNIHIDFDLSDCFHLVQVSNFIYGETEQRLTVQAVEPKLAGNWAIDDSSRQCKVVFQNDLAEFLLDNIQPEDLLCIWGARLVLDNNNGVIIQTNSSKSSPLTIMLFRPDSENAASIVDEVNHFLLWFRTNTSSKCCKYEGESDTVVVKVFPSQGICCTKSKGVGVTPYSSGSSAAKPPLSLGSESDKTSLSPCTCDPTSTSINVNTSFENSLGDSVETPDFKNYTKITITRKLHFPSERSLQKDFDKNCKTYERTNPPASKCKSPYKRKS